LSVDWKEKFRVGQNPEQSKAQWSDSAYLQIKKVGQFLKGIDKNFEMVKPLQGLTYTK
jgi:hypothetical protein